MLRLRKHIISGRKKSMRFVPRQSVVKVEKKIPSTMVGHLLSLAPIRARHMAEDILSNAVTPNYISTTLPLDKLDYVGAVCFTGNTERHHLLMNEFARCGFPNPYVVWAFPSPYRKFILSRIRHLSSLDEHPGYWGAGLAHYQHLKIAYELGCKNALIVEDDCRFLKDADYIRQTMNNVPKNWDILMLDNFTVKGLQKPIKGWAKCSASYSTACYIVNRRAMSKIIALNEAPVTGSGIMRHCDHWTDTQFLGQSFNIYCAKPNLAIQCYCPGQTNGGGDYMQQRYIRAGLSLDAYHPYGQTINIFYCVNSSPTARKWMEYSIDSIRNLYGKAKGVKIFVASDTPYVAEGVQWIDAVPYIRQYGISRISQVQKHGRTASPMQIFRLAAPLIKEFENIDRILYLDIDTEVVGSGLTELLDKDFDADVMALTEHSGHGNTSTSIMLRDSELLGMMSPHTVSRLRDGGYFNNGVMVMNLKRMRRAHPTWGKQLPLFIEMAVKHHRVVVDQDISNVILDSIPLPPEFNVMPDTDVVIPKVPPVLIHYANTNKYKSQIYPPKGLKEKCFP